VWNWPGWGLGSCLGGQRHLRFSHTEGCRSYFAAASRASDLTASLLRPAGQRDEPADDDDANEAESAKCSHHSSLSEFGFAACFAAALKVHVDLTMQNR
jgi:hypothetical protein